MSIPPSLADSNSQGTPLEAAPSTLPFPTPGNAGGPANPGNPGNGAQAAENQTAGIAADNISLDADAPAAPRPFPRSLLMVGLAGIALGIWLNVRAGENPAPAAESTPVAAAAPAAPQEAHTDAPLSFPAPKAAAKTGADAKAAIPAPTPHATPHRADRPHPARDEAAPGPVVDGQTREYAGELHPHPPKAAPAKPRYDSTDPNIPLDKLAPDLFEVVPAGRR